MSDNALCPVRGYERFLRTIDPDIAYRELWHIGIKDQIILNYIYRFIKKGYYEDSCKVENRKALHKVRFWGR